MNEQSNYVNFKNAFELLLFATNQRPKTMSELTFILEEYFKNTKYTEEVPGEEFDQQYYNMFLETIIFPIIKSSSKNLYKLYNSILKIEILLEQYSIIRVIPESYFYNKETETPRYEVYPQELWYTNDREDPQFYYEDDERGYIIYKNFITYFNINEEDLSYTTFKNITYNIVGEGELDKWRIKFNSIRYKGSSVYSNFENAFDLLAFVTNKRKRSLEELKVIIIEVFISRIEQIEMHERIRQFCTLILKQIKNINDLYKSINKLSDNKIDPIIPIEYFYTNYEDGIINVNSFPEYLFTTEVNYYNEEVLVFKNFEDEEGYIVYKNYLKFYNMTENDMSYISFKSLMYYQKADTWLLKVNMPSID